jgi:hypothetical protein
MDTKNMKTRILGLLFALLFCAQAQAIQISAVGDTFTVDWSTTTTNGSLLSATTTWTVDSFSTTQILLSIDITNTTMLTSLLTNADIVSFGFGVTPNAKATITQQGSVFDSVGVGSGPQQTFPGGYKNIDVCVYAQGCSGGTVNDALHAGDSDSLQLLLKGDFSGGFADLLYFPLKFQTSDGSYEPAGCVNCPTQVPEPSILGMMGLGLLLIGLVRIRRRVPVSIRR